MPYPDVTSCHIPIDEMMAHYKNLPLACFKPAKHSGEVVAIMGGAHIDGSFKNLLGLGMMTLAKEQGYLRKGQPVIESTSGSMGEGLAVAGKLLGHPITLVSDCGLPKWTAKRITELGARLVIVDKPDPKLGFQAARENKVRQLVYENQDLYWLDQNNNPLNPLTYSKWLIPCLSKKINPLEFKAAAFCVGSGGHFSALSSWLKSINPKIKTYAIDRPGSITFGGIPAPSKMRGIGNQNIVPAVIKAHLHLVDGIETVDDGSAFRMCRALGKSGCFVGGSSGAAFVAASNIATRHRGRVLTLFPDRGEIYCDTIWDDEWMNSNGFVRKGHRNGKSTLDFV